MNQVTSSQPKSASIEATIIRVDGTRVPLGVISYWHRNPFKRLLWWLKQNAL